MVRAREYGTIQGDLLGLISAKEDTSPVLRRGKRPLPDWRGAGLRLSVKGEGYDRAPHACFRLWECQLREEKMGR